MKRWVMAVGENPLRILRVAHTVQPVEIAVITTPETDYLIEEIAAAAGEMDIDVVLRDVPGDAYRFDVTLAALLDVVGNDADQWQWVIAGGTKPMIAAQSAVAVDVPTDQMWSLHDATGTLHSWAGVVLDLVVPQKNISLRSLARLHAGLEVVLDATFPAPQRPEDVGESRIRDRRKRWFGHEKWSGNADRVYRNRVAEADFMALVRAILPSEFDVYGGTTVDLRDSADPQRPAPNPFAADDLFSKTRTFEVDGVVIRGFDAWVLEYKNAALKSSELRKHAAELDQRRRHLGGDSAVGILVSITRGEADDPDSVSPLSGLVFELGRTLHIDQPLLIEASSAWLKRDGRRSRLREVFG